MTNKPLMIGDLGRATATKPTTIRYYEDIGLLRPPPRTRSGRRTYGKGDQERLGFIRNARRLGFAIDEIRSLIELAEHPDQECSSATEIAKRHLTEIDEKLNRLTLLRDQLVPIAGGCSEDHSSDCRVIQGIARLSQRETDKPSGAKRV